MRDDLVVVVEEFVPGKRAIELRRTPIGTSDKTSNHVLLLIKQIEFIFGWQEPISKSTAPIVDAQECCVGVPTSLSLDDSSLCLLRLSPRPFLLPLLTK